MVYAGWTCECKAEVTGAQLCHLRIKHRLAPAPISFQICSSSLSTTFHYFETIGIIMYIIICTLKINQIFNREHITRQMHCTYCSSQSTLNHTNFPLWGHICLVFNCRFFNFYFGLLCSAWKLAVKNVASKAQIGHSNIKMSSAPWELPPWPWPDEGLCPWTQLGAPPPDLHYRFTLRCLPYSTSPLFTTGCTFYYSHWLLTLCLYFCGMILLNRLSWLPH